MRELAQVPIGPWASVVLFARNVGRRCRELFRRRTLLERLNGQWSRR